MLALNTQICLAIEQLRWVAEQIGCETRLYRQNPRIKTAAEKSDRAQLMLKFVCGDRCVWLMHSIT